MLSHRFILRKDDKLRNTSVGEVSRSSFHKRRRRNRIIATRENQRVIVNRLRHISEFLALRRNTSLLLVALLLAGTGEKLWLGFAPKYIETLGGSILVIGLFDALQTLLGAIYAYPGGWLTDRWGQRKSLLLFSLISIAGYLLVLVWQSWVALLLGSFLFLAWSALSLPATFSVMATSLKTTATRWASACNPWCAACR